jgi:hypothetical protein
LIKKLSVDNLKLDIENKKISQLMEKVIDSYNSESHKNFIENGIENDILKSNLFLFKFINLIFNNIS